MVSTRFVLAASSAVLSFLVFAQRASACSPWSAEPWLGDSVLPVTRANVIRNPALFVGDDPSRRLLDGAGREIAVEEVPGLPFVRPSELLTADTTYVWQTALRRPAVEFTTGERVDETPPPPLRIISTDGWVDRDDCSRPARVTVLFEIDGVDDATAQEHLRIAIYYGDAGTWREQAWVREPHYAYPMYDQDHPNARRVNLDFFPLDLDAKGNSRDLQAVFVATVDEAGRRGPPISVDLVPKGGGCSMLARASSDPGPSTVTLAMLALLRRRRGSLRAGRPWSHPTRQSRPPPRRLVREQDRSRRRQRTHLPQLR